MAQHCPWFLGFDLKAFLYSFLISLLIEMRKSIDTNGFRLNKVPRWGNKVPRWGNKVPRWGE